VPKAAARRRTASKIGGTRTARKGETHRFKTGRNAAIGDFVSENLLRIRQVMARVGLKQTRIYQLCGDGLFPQPVRLGDRAVAWPESEIDDWIAARVAKPRVQIKTSWAKTRERRKARIAELQALRAVPAQEPESE
jgi:prophage regulatory protein